MLLLALKDKPGIFKEKIPDMDAQTEDNNLSTWFDLGKLKNNFKPARYHEQFMIDKLPSRVFEHRFRKKPQKENNNDNNPALVEEEQLLLALPYHIGTSIDTPLSLK